ncbi:MAG: N-6 DNA methylase [Alistipes sp.]|nr:N-6 DNA methylase [Alistipes sp.]
MENSLILNNIQDPFSCFTEIQSAAKYAHISVINGLIRSYLKQHTDQSDAILSSCFENADCVADITQDINVSNVSALCEQLHILYLNSKFTYANGRISRGKSKENLIETGSVYTREDISYNIVESTLGNVGYILPEAKILDFACGTGRFYDAIIQYLSCKGIDAQSAVTNNVYAIDIDPVAINITRLKAFEHYGEVNLEIADIIKNNIILRNALVKESLYAVVENAIRYDDFDGLVKQGFDAIVSNPPYLVLKPTKDKFSEESAILTKNLVNYFRTSGNYEYSVEGMLNYYQISIEAMLQMLKKGGELGVICPSTLFADVSATKLRKHLLLSNNVRYIRYYTEKDPLFVNVTQATCIFHLTKGGTTDDIEVHSEGTKFDITLQSIQKMFGAQYEVPSISDHGWTILLKLSKFPKLSTYKHIRNKRGELDLTLYREYISKIKTPYRLVRGNMLSPYGIKDINGEYVSEEFIAKKSSDYINFDFGKRRLVCQQISNAASKRRLKFVFCETNDILGNSCNYISSDPTTLKKLNILLNSSLLDWRFRVTSSNNHINNYELNELPIVDLSKVDENFKWNSIDELDSYVGKLYGLTEDEIKYMA